VAQRHVFGAGVANLVEGDDDVLGHENFMLPISRQNCDKRFPDNNNYQARQAV
jgi:hypothetical protein